MADDKVTLSPAKVEKAREAIEFLSSLPLPSTRGTEGAQRPSPNRAVHSDPEQPMQSLHMRILYLVPVQVGENAAMKVKANAAQNRL